MSDEDDSTDETAAGADEPERDPFGLLEDAAADREGDPFDALGDPDADGDVDRNHESRAATGTEAEPADEPSPVQGSDSATGDGELDSSTIEAGERDDGDDGEPRDGFQEVSEPEVRPGAPSVGGAESDSVDGGVDRGDPFAGESAFQEMDVGEIDEDEVWRQISDAQSRGSVKGARERDYAEVSKHRYCERCEHFTEPPEVRCTNEGTEILEFVDNESVRVADCPVVAERRALRRGSESE